MGLLKYLEVNYPPNVRPIFGSNKVRAPDFALPYRFKETIKDKEVIPQKYIKHGISPDFLNNFGEESA